MRLSNIAVWSGVAAVAFALSALPASAGPKQGVSAKRSADVSSQSRTRQVRHARARTRITVQPRSYLDGGTEVLPGDRKFTDYVYRPGYSPMQVVSGAGANAGFQNPSWPLPGPFDLPGRNNPRQF
jgi:hypothetical protein